MPARDGPMTAPARQETNATCGGGLGDARGGSGRDVCAEVARQHRAPRADDEAHRGEPIGAPRQVYG